MPLPNREDALSASDAKAWGSLAHGREWTAEGQAMRALLFDLEPQPTTETP